MAVSHVNPEELVDTSLIAVERALSELRAGRAVVVSDAQTRLIAIGVEALDATAAGWLGTFTGEGGLVLPAPRLRHLGVAGAATGVVRVRARDHAQDRAQDRAQDMERIMERIRALTLGVDARIDTPVAAATALDLAALDLMHLALILPAAYVAAPKAAVPDHLLHVRSEDIVRYRQVRSRRLRLVSRAPVPLEGAQGCEFVIFRGGEGLRDQVAVIVGRPDMSKPVAVRLHSACLTGDLFGSLKCDCGDQLRHTVRWMATNGGGVLLYLDQEGRGNGIANKIRAYKLQSEGYDTYDADEILGFELDQRHFDFAAEMLRQIGVSRVRILTNNPQKVAAMKRAGLDVVSEQRVIGRPTAENQDYLASKRDRAGHFIDVEPVLSRAGD